MQASKALGAFRRILRHTSPLSAREIANQSSSSGHLSRIPCRVAVLYQAVEPPTVNGVRKPKKPGGYQDSGADIAYVLQKSGQDIVTPQSNPHSSSDEGWCFPDTEDGLVSAVRKGATHLWANTILFAAHPLQTCRALDDAAAQLRIVGQPPRFVKQYDDKNHVNGLLRRDRRFTLPAAWIIESTDAPVLARLPHPVVGKPIRGRGSHGVKLCHNKTELKEHLEAILGEGPQVMIEEYLAGEEGTVTVLPPSPEMPRYWSLPIVIRSNHKEGIAPYNGIVAVTQNSHVPSVEELKEDISCAEICEQCEKVAELLQVTAPIRIDVRRRANNAGSPFAIFDVNMKPNMTGPGRPGREDQASLTALAAKGIGWDYVELLKRILRSAKALQELRSLDVKPV